MSNKIGVVAFIILDRLRIKTLFHFSDNFNIDIYSEIINASSGIPQKDQILSESFVDFLKRNKEFIIAVRN